MAIANMEVERENMELIRGQAQASMADPLEIEVIESTLFIDVTDYQPPTGIVLHDANQASAFFDIIQQEIGRARINNVRFAANLRPDYDQQTPFAHELAHIEEAERQGVDLSQCALEAFFTTGDEGVGILLNFKIPHNTNPAVKAAISRAPEKPSFNDLLHSNY